MIVLVFSKDPWDDSDAKYLIFKKKSKQRKRKKKEKKLENAHIPGVQYWPAKAFLSGQNWEE